MVAQEQLVTAEDFAGLPDDGSRHELVKGAIIEVVRPTFAHGRVQTRIARFLDAFLDNHALGWITTETGYILSRNPDTVRGPDVAFVSKTRLNKPEPDAFIPIAPDLAVEVVSPNDRATEINAKVVEYLQAGTRLVWVVYPDVQNAHVYRPGGKGEIIDRDGVLDGEDVLPGFKLALRDVYEGWEE